MNLISPLVRNSVWLFFSRVGAQGAMIVVTFLLARRLGTIGFGEYAFIAAAIMIGNTLTTFGTDIFLIREIAAGAVRRSLTAALVIQLVFSVLFVGCVYFGAAHLPNQSLDSIAALRIYSFALFPLSFYTIFTSILRGRQRMDLYTWLNLAVSLVHVIVIWQFIPVGVRVVELAYALLAIQFFGALAGGIICFVFSPTDWKVGDVTPSAVARLLADCIQIAGIAVLRVLNQRLSLILLAVLGGAASTGWFSAAARIVEAARIGHHAVFSALFPLMSQASGEGGTDVAGRFKLPLLVLVLASGAGTLFINIFAAPLIDLVYGIPYRPSLSALRILSFVLVPYTINDYFSISLIAQNQEGTLVRVMLVYVVALLCSTLLLVPAGGQAGASWAILIAEILQAVLLLLTWNVKKENASRTARIALEP
jgi:PST family polysaccharide transporter